MKYLHWMTLLIPLCLLLGSGCASLFSKSKYPVQITSHPSASSFSITNRKGKQVYTGRTPATVSLRAGQGFFTPAHYTLKFNKIGYEEQVYTLQSTVDGWYVSNIFWGIFSLVGYLVIDPATGAMFRLDDRFVSVALEESMMTTEVEEIAPLKLFDLEKIPAEWKPHLLELKSPAIPTK